MPDLAKILRDLPSAEREAFSERMRGNEPTMSKYEANYTNDPAADAGRCRDCSMYRGPERCTLVAGIIDPDGHCDHFEPREGGSALAPEPGMGGAGGAMPPAGMGMY